MVRICLVKADKTAGSCWHSLLTDQFAADPFVADQMQQKLTLQRFQLEVSKLLMCLKSTVIITFYPLLTRSCNQSTQFLSVS